MDFKYKKLDMFKPNEQIQLLPSSKNDASIPHSHEFVELVYIFSGKGIHRINNATYFISAGDLLLIRTDESHSIHPLSDDSSTLQWINCIFLPEFIDFNLDVFIPGHRFIGTFGYEMNFLFQSMVDEFTHKKSGYLDVLRSYLYIVLSKLTRVTDPSISTEIYAHTKKQMLVKRALDYIQLHYRDKLTLSTVASALGISASYLSRLFKLFVQSGVTEYINNYRLEQSCKLLYNPSLTIGEIASEAGFCDTKFYYTYFERHMGISPGEFRRKHCCSNK